MKAATVNRPSRTIAQVRAVGSRAKVAVRFDSATIRRLDATAQELTRMTGEVHTRSDVVRTAVAQLLGGSTS